MQIDGKSMDESQITEHCETTYGPSSDAHMRTDMLCLASELFSFVVGRLFLSRAKGLPSTGPRGFVLRAGACPLRLVD